MYKQGHLGAALLVYAPLGFVATLVAGLELAVIGGVVAAGLASVPDLDMRVPLVPHRGPTHTAWFAVLIGLGVGALGVVAGMQSGILAAIALGGFGFFVGGLAIASHLAADALTPMGIQPFKPWRSDKYTWDLVKAANPIANYALLALGAGVAVGAGVTGMWLRNLVGL